MQLETAGSDGRGALARAVARHRICVRGVVQGVGYRPFVYSLARELGLSGEVGNTADGVVIEVEGRADLLTDFVRRLSADAPVLSSVESVAVEVVARRGGTDFAIADSRGGTGRTLVSPDMATCQACSAELADPCDRRYRHPFISCTNCGPRFTIVVELPYDRPATTMASLPLCPTCAAEYADPADRRFHAQTVACRDCGPTLRLERPGAADLIADAAVAEARRLLAAGAVVAVKGLGGYHLACDATNEATVAALRKGKDRGDKPFAVMVPDLATAGAIAWTSAVEQELLGDPRRPVVLLSKRAHCEIEVAPSVSPEHPDIGVMLPYTPLHHLLFGLAGDPAGPAVLVMTSGNGSGEPIVTDDVQARTRLASFAEAWLTHDRPIQVPCDDSVVRVAGSRVLPVRRSRGYAPLPVALPVPVQPALAVGGDLKNTFCVAEDGYAWLSAHVGDMDDLATLHAFEAATGHLRAITGVRPDVIVADKHPAYRSTAWADRNPDGLEVRKVQHHHAHIASAMAENGHDGRERVIGFAFDGTGYGDDGAVWGGEVLTADYGGYERAAHLNYVWLPGGDAGVRNPCRMALSHLHAADVPWDPRLPSVAVCTSAEISVLARQLATGLRCAQTSSMGRLFDAMSSLAGVCHRVAYEAEAAMRFEELARGSIAGCEGAYEFALIDDIGPLRVDPRPVVAAAAADVLLGTGADVIAARFHRGVVDVVGTVAGRLREETGLTTVALSGGVFLNVLLTTLCEERLRSDGFRVLSHHRVPPSDAGISLGQIAIGARYPATSGAAPVGGVREVREVRELEHDEANRSTTQRRTPCA